ncbi:MAG: hypothetical protein ACFCUR_09760 [Rhodomicrobiaceae bacterium]
MVNLRRQFSEISAGMRIMLIPLAVITGIFNKVCFSDAMGAGQDWWLNFLALAAAIGVGLAYWAGFSILLGVVAFAPRADRTRLMPVIILMVVILMASSSYPNVQVLAGGPAAAIEVSEYIQNAAAKADRVKAWVHRLGQAGAVLQGKAGVHRDSETREKRGLLSGFDSDDARPGPVSDWIGGYAKRFEDLVAQLAQAREKSDGVVARIDAATAAMREATADVSLDAASRQTAMQAAGDQFRTAVIELKEAVPIAAMASLAKALQGPQPRPALSGNELIRAGQLQAVETVETALKQQGQEIEAVLAELTVGDAGHDIAPFAPAPASVLVIKHAWQVANFILAAVAIDLAPFALFLIMARVNDALRRTRHQDEDLESVSVGDLERAQRAEQYLKARRARADYGLIEGPLADYLKRKDGSEGRS